MSVPNSVEYLPSVAFKLFDDAVDTRQRTEAFALPISGWSDLLGQFPGVTPLNMFAELEPAAINELVDRARLTSPEYQPPNFHAYFVMRCPKDIDPESVASALRRHRDVVEWAYVESGPTPPPGNPGNDPLQATQGYEDQAPIGIDAEFAWTFAGGDGTGTGFIDIEQGWTLDHEDLKAANITLLSGLNQDFFGHGTAVLGQVCAVENKLGVKGIAPACSARVVSQFASSGSYETSTAIMAAASASAKGDIMLIEAQASVAGQLVPVEAEQAVFDVIKHAVAIGVIVVEASNNGRRNLDKWTTPEGTYAFKRTVRDSGAILVGAASSAVPHTRQYCGFGSRVDCYAWGEYVASAGDGAYGTSTTDYTSSFGGTSAASAIIAGAALCVQGVAKSAGHVVLPWQMRKLLSDPTSGTPSAHPAKDKIGVMPDLRKILTAAGTGGLSQGFGFPGP